MVNKVILIGNVGADPEVRYLEGGVAVANLRLATTERYKNKNGENIGGALNEPACLRDDAL